MFLPSSSSHSRSSEVPSSLVERVLVVKSQLHSVFGVTTFVSDGSPGNKQKACKPDLSWIYTRNVQQNDYLLDADTAGSWFLQFSTSCRGPQSNRSSFFFGKSLKILQIWWSSSVDPGVQFTWQIFKAMLLCSPVSNVHLLTGSLEVVLHQERHTFWVVVVFEDKETTHTQVCFWLLEVFF